MNDQAPYVSTEALEQQLAAAKRLLHANEAQESLLRYIQLGMPDPEDPDNVDKSAYEITPQARLLCQIFEKATRGELKRVAVSVGPQLGKSEVLSRRGPAWFSGTFPRRHLMLGTYNQDFADEFGSDVRTIIRSPYHRQVFPQHQLARGAQATDYMRTSLGGKLAFVGVGGSGTGKPADMFVVDDPIRNDDDVRSALFRERLWMWFNRVVFTRCHSGSSIVCVHTRWHEDDLIGRLCDPDHPERNKKYAGIADNWTYIDIPAVVKDPRLASALGLTLDVPDDPLVIEQFGEVPMAALWEARKGLAFLAEARRQDPRGFDALYMGRPAPEDGDYFKADWIVEYSADELPQSLRIYVASDHALKTKEANDATCMIVFGVDARDDVWILEATWGRINTLKQVDAMLDIARRRRPIIWWAGQDHISGSIGPFLRRRMQETGDYFHISELSERGDKEQKAQAIKGRMAQKKVHFPRQAAWFQDAKKEILMFPNGAHDDFVDALANFGRGLTRQVGATEATTTENKPARGTWAHLKASSRAREHRERRANAGM